MPLIPIHRLKRVFSNKMPWEMAERISETMLEKENA